MNRLRIVWVLCLLTALIAQAFPLAGCSSACTDNACPMHRAASIEPSASCCHPAKASAPNSSEEKCRCALTNTPPPVMQTASPALLTLPLQWVILLPTIYKLELTEVEETSIPIVYRDIGPPRWVITDSYLGRAPPVSA